MPISAEDQNECPVYYPNEEFRETAHIQSMETYKKMYLKSIENPEQFWREMSSDFYFKSEPKAEFFKYNFDIRKGPVEVKWMEGAITNVCYNVLDRNIEKGLGDRTAIIWEGSEPYFHRTITYNELKSEVCKFANVLKKKGIGKNDRVAIYLPVTIELVISMLACARIGAIHSVVFAGFSGDSIADRILDCNCKLLVTCDGVYRGNKFIPLKEMADQAVQICKEHNHQLNGVIVYHHLKNLKNPVEEETKTKKLNEINSNGQLNNSKPNSSNLKVNGHANVSKIIQPSDQVISNGKVKNNEQKVSQKEEQKKNLPVGQENLNGKINRQTVEKTAISAEKANLKVEKNGGQKNDTKIDSKIDSIEATAQNDENDVEAMDTSEPTNDLEEIFETDQNNNIVIIKNKKNNKDSANVQQCKLNNSINQNQKSATIDKSINAFKNEVFTKIIDKNNCKLSNDKVLKTNLNSSNEINIQEKKSSKEQNMSEEKILSKIIKPNTTSSSSTKNTTPKNNLPIKTNTVSKLRKIAADSVHNAIKFKKVDEQTAITTANGLKNEKKILKCANNGNLLDKLNSIDTAKINRFLLDQLVKSRLDKEELDSSPKENDNTLAQTQQTQSQPLTNAKKTNTSGKNKIPWNPKIDFWWHDLMNQVDDVCEPVWLDAEHPLFILYTSGSTGKPKGVLHTSGGYMIYAATTFKYVFNYHGGDVFFCTADLGWITGHTVNCYGSLANAATIVLFDGTPFYPTASRLWQIVASHRVNIFYTAPTAIRSLMGCGEKWVKDFDLSSLKLLGTAGEPINPEAWDWYYRVIGKSKCPIVDTWWQTETGAPLISSLPGCTPMKPGSATYPFFGVVPALLDDEGKELIGPASGHLVFKNAWPGMIRTVDGNHHRFQCTYFYKFPGYYCAGDGAKRDKDGYYWITGRTDDLLNVSGHLLSTAQIESALTANDIVAEAAAVSAPHKIKGECIYCYIVLKKDFTFNKIIENDLKTSVRHRIGAIATPEVLHVVSALPKTRSGKIMRRLLRKIAIGETEFGDVSTLQDESILNEIYETRRIYVF